MKFSVNKKFVQSAFGKDILLSLAVQVIVMFCSFAVNKIISVRLGLEGYGEFSIIKKTASVLGLVMICGMGIALPRYLSMHRIKKAALEEKTFFTASFIIVLCVSLTIALVVILFRQAAFSFIFDNMPKYEYLAPLLLYSFSICISTYLFSFFRGKGKYIQSNFAHIVVQGLMLAGCFFTFVNLIFVFYVWSFSIIAYSLYYLLNETWHFRKDLVNILKNITKPTKHLLQYSIPRTLGDFFLFSFAAYPLIIINGKAGLSETGLFSAAVTINTMITPLFSFVGTILLQRTSESYAANNIRPMVQIINKMLCGYIGIALVSAFIITFMSPFIIRLFFASDFLEAVPICMIISWSLVPNAVYLLLRNPLDALSVFPHNTLNLFLSFAVLAIGLHYTDTVEGFSYTYLLSYVLMALISFSSWLYVKNKKYE